MMTLHWLSAVLTCPGAILRAFLEHILLKIMHVPIEDTAYLQRNELCGHVEHKPVRSLGKSVVLCLVPGLLLLLLGMVFWIPSALQLFYLGLQPVGIASGGVSVLFWVCVVFYYLGVCCLCHVFPSYEDALYLAESCGEAKLPAKIFLFLPVQCARAGAFLQRYAVFPLLWIAATVCLILFG